MKIDTLTITGEKGGGVELPEQWFGARVNPELMAQAVRVYLANQRSAGAKTKGRGEIALTTKKWYRQKGTGRARHGAKSAPIFVGGSKAHGPTGQENYSLKLPKKMKRAALASALTMMLKQNKVMVIEGVEKLEAKTKLAARAVGIWKLDGKKFVLVVPEKLENVWRAFRNLENSKLRLVSQLNTYEVLNSGMLIWMKEAVERMVEISFNPESVKTLKQKKEYQNKELKIQTNKTAIKPEIKSDRKKVVKTKKVSEKTTAKKTVGKVKAVSKTKRTSLT